ncbi:DUF2637 domain-containing protein [Micromonospora globbae]|uniref:DUF2637 domain-containing protein n=1 Tax=Micromonospora globbae TaxID=1894969 RepID=A0A420EX03_9ACTN|nr:DUF2637 domain-containing protein [Micromonospora globbae]RKF25244.1 DUF2637 domain-containing protein [Micromonospora globbae]
MNATAVTSRLTTGLVALVAGYASYRHIVSVALEAGEHASVAVVYPLAIDGAILVGTLAMLEDKRAGRKPRLSARVALAFGIVATIAANIASAAPTLTARLVAAVPPVAFLIAVEVLSRRGKLIAEPVAEPVVIPAPEPVAEPEPVDPWRYAEPVAEPQPEPVAAPRPKRLTPRSATSADRVMAAHLAEPDATHARIAELAGVSLATVKRYRPSKINGSPTGAQPAETRVNGAVTELAEVIR